MTKTELMYENDKAKFYNTEMADTLTDYCTMNLGMRTPKLKGWKCYLALEKDTKTKSFVLFNDKGEPVYSTNKFDAMASHIDMIRLSRKRIRV